MDKEELIRRLMAKTNLSYEDNRKALEEVGWDILEAVLLLENRGIIEKPRVSIFFTNKLYEEEAEDKIVIVENKKDERKNFIEGICSLIDKSNNIFLKMSRNEKVLLELSLTVIILLLFFTFWITVPLVIIGLFHDIEYSFAGRGIENTKINEILNKISRKIQDRKNKRWGRKD